MFDCQSFRNAFSSVSNSDFICFDNAATAQKPDCMVRALSSYYGTALGSAGRGQSPLSEKATTAYRDARNSILHFVGATSPEEVIFTYGATDSLNMLAGFFRDKAGPGKNIVISALEHNANYLPWKHLCETTGAQLRIIELDKNGVPDITHASQLLDNNTLLLSVTAASNLTGGIPDAKALCALAHRVGALAAIDASQLIPHTKIDVKDLDCDYLAFSAHKVYGPEGLGILYRRAMLGNTPAPFRFGGGMAEEESDGNIRSRELPDGAEAGTHHTAAASAFATVIEFLSQFDHAEMLAYTRSLSRFIHSELSRVEGIRFIGYQEDNLPVLSMVFDDRAPADIDMYLALRKICARSGKHCAFLPISRLAKGGTLRVSLSPYNTIEEAETFVLAIKNALAYFERKKR